MSPGNNGGRQRRWALKHHNHTRTTENRKYRSIEPKPKQFEKARNNIYIYNVENTHNDKYVITASLLAKGETFLHMEMSIIFNDFAN